MSQISKKYSEKTGSRTIEYDSFKADLTKI
jgi:hypothetical protein